MKKFFSEFKTFALRGNMMDMAVGVMIGGAFSGIVKALTDNFIQPVLNVFTGGAVYTMQNVSGFVSAFLSSLANFFIMAFVLFCLLKASTGCWPWARRRPPKPPQPKPAPIAIAPLPSRPPVAPTAPPSWNRLRRNSFNKKNSLRKEAVFGGIVSPRGCFCDRPGSFPV